MEEELSVLLCLNVVCVFGGAYVPDYNCGLIHFWKAHVMSVNFTEGFLRGCGCFAPPRKVLPDALDPEGP